MLGIYYYSMMVVSLSVNVVVEIGGWLLLIWVVCYYYDIGKIKYVNFFVENLFVGVENLYNFLLLEDSK